MRMNRQNLIHILFRIGIFFKGLDGILEIAGGLFLLFITREEIIRFILTAFHHELTEDPDDFLINYLITMAGHLSLSTKTFASIYLIGHGLVKAGLVTALWRNKLWAYPIAGFVLTIYVIYQTIRLFSTHSLLLLLLTIIDIIILLFLRPEYKRLTNAAKQANAP